MASIALLDGLACGAKKLGEENCRVLAAERLRSPAAAAGETLNPDFT